MNDLGYSETKLFGQITEFQKKLLPEQSSEMDDGA